MGKIQPLLQPIRRSHSRRPSTEGAMSEYAYHYSRFPALRAYIDRVGAEQINFRRFVVKEVVGKYYRVIATIRIVNASVSCDSAEHAPTAEELDAIEAELAGKEFPKSIPASKTKVEQLVRSDKITGTLTCSTTSTATTWSWSRSGASSRTANKYFVPWTMFMAKGGSPMWE